MNGDWQKTRWIDKTTKRSGGGVIRRGIDEIV